MTIPSIIRFGGALLFAVAIAVGSTAGAAQAETAPPPPEPVILEPAVYPGDPIPATFTGTDVNVRKSPHLEARIVAVGQPGDRITVRCGKLFGAFKGAPAAVWYRVTGPNAAYQGWVYADYVRPVEPAMICGVGVG